MSRTISWSVLFRFIRTSLIAASPFCVDVPFRACPFDSVAILLIGAVLGEHTERRAAADETEFTRKKNKTKIKSKLNYSIGRGDMCYSNCLVRLSQCTTFTYEFSSKLRKFIQTTMTIKTHIYKIQIYLEINNTHKSQLKMAHTKIHISFTHI